MSTIVLVHGAFHGPWCFDPLVAELDRRGITSIAPELPLTSLTEDVAVVRSLLDSLEGPVTLLGHSYGGAVVTEAGTHHAVGHLVLLAALAPDDGESASGGPVEIGESFMTALRPTDNGMLQVEATMAAAAFYPDADPEAAAACVAKLRPGRTGRSDELVTRAAWREKPTTYIVCTDDPIVLPSGQRALAARTGATVLDIGGDHSPFLARPAELAELLIPLI